MTERDPDPRWTAAYAACAVFSFCCLGRMETLDNLHVFNRGPVIAWLLLSTAGLIIEFASPAFYRWLDRKRNAP